MVGVVVRSGEGMRMVGVVVRSGEGMRMVGVEVRSTRLVVSHFLIFERHEALLGIVDSGVLL